MEVPEYIFEHFPSPNDDHINIKQKTLIQKYFLRILSHLFTRERLSYFLELEFPKHLLNFTNFISIEYLLQFFHILIDLTPEGRNALIDSNIIKHLVSKLVKENVNQHLDISENDLTPEIFDFGQRSLTFSDKINIIMILSNVMKYIQDPKILNEFIDFPYEILIDYVPTNAQQYVISILNLGLSNQILAEKILPVIQNEEFHEMIEDIISSGDNDEQIRIFYQQLKNALEL